MKKLIKYMCVLAIAAIATIIIMYNMASADNENQAPTMSASNVSTSEDTATITVSFGGDIEGVTSGMIKIDCPKGISCSEGTSKLIDSTDGITSFKFKFTGFSAYSGNEAEITFDIGKSTDWSYISKSQGKVIQGAAMRATSKVTIEKQEPDREDNEFELAFTEISMNKGESKDLPGTNPQKEVTWKSENSAVATIEGNKIVSKGEGETNLVATAGEGENAVSKKIKVIVSSVQNPDHGDNNEFELEFSEISMNKGESKDLPGTNPQKEVTWKSENSAVATIEGNKIVSKGEGETNLVATAGEGETAVSKKLKVTIKAVQSPDPGNNQGEDPGENPNPGEEPTQPVVDNEPPKIAPDIMKLYVGEVDRYGADKDVTWSSSDNSVAIINQSSGQVTAVGEGKATITATANNGKKATAQIIVERKSSGGNEAADPVISQNSDFTINAGDTYQLNADMAVEWISSDESVVTIDANGLVKGVSAGKAFIYAKSKDLRVSSVGVTVKGTPAKGNTGNTGSNGGTKTNKTGNATTGNENSSSTVNEAVPSTGEASTGTLVILGAITLIVAAVLFRKRMK